MKTFSQLLSEVAQPRGEDEKHFKDKHIVAKKKHPVAPDEVFTGGIKKSPKRLADYEVGEDELVYEGSAFDVPTAEGGEHDEEESHKKYKRGNRSTPLRREAKMDPVGQEDDDINNDGVVDSSDKYLHNRRRAIKNAMKKEAKEYGPGHIGAIQKMLDKERDAKKSTKKEEAEIDEAAPKIKSDFVKTQREKDRSHDAAMGRTPTGRKKVMTSTQRSMASMRKEETDLDESWSDGISSRTAHVHWSAATKYRKKAIASATMAKRHDKGSPEHSKHMANYHSTMAKHIKSAYHAGQYGDMATAKKDHKAEMAKAKEYKSSMSEEFDLDEISRDTVRSYIRKAMAHKTTGETPKKDRSSGVNLAGKKSYGIGGKAKVAATESVELEEKLVGRQRELDHNKNGKIDAHDFHLMRKKKKMQQEEAEQLDELSPRVKASYLTKAKADQKSAQKRYTKGAYRNDGANFFDADTLEMEKDAKRMEKRRKGIAMAKEEVDLDESNDASVQRSLSAHRIKQAAKIKAGIPLRRPGEGLAAYVTRKAKAQAKMQKEEVELSESIDQIKKHHVSNIAHFDNHSSPDTALSVHHQRMTRLHSDAASKAKQSGNKKMADAHSSAANAHRSANGTASAFNRAVEKTKQTFNESLDEVSKKTLGSYADKARAQRGAGKDREKGISMAVRKSTASAENPYDRGPRVRATEEAEQLDELSPKTLASYVKKAQKSSDKHFDKAGMALAKSQDAGERAHKSDTDRGYDYHKDREAKHDQKFRDHDRLHRKRETGISRANRRIGESAEQLDESITKMSSARLKFHATKKIPHGSFSNAEIEDEHDRRKKTDPNYHGVKPSLSEVTRTAVKKTISYVGPDGKARTRNVPIKNVGRDDYGQEKIRTDESADLNEVFNQGSIKLNNGSSVILRKEDADVLNRMFKGLSSSNRKRMEEIAMRDKNGFNEILSFAREAL